MTNERYSLCITSILQKNQKIMYYRIADYDCNTCKFSQATYTAEENAYAYEFDPPFIGGFPTQTAIAEVRAWTTYEEDKKKSSSKEYAAYSYEILFPSEFDGLRKYSESQVRQILSEGISIPSYVQGAFLVAVCKENGEYIAVECQRKSFLLKNNKFHIDISDVDVLHAVHYLNLYKFSNENIVDTDISEFRLYLSEIEQSPIRYFYASTKLPETTEIFHVRSVESYAPIYFNRYLKKRKRILQFSDGDLKKFIDVIRESMDDAAELNSFFAVTGLPEEKIKSCLKTLDENLVNRFLEDDECDFMIRKVLLANKSVLERCTAIAKNKWMYDADQERSELENKILKEKTSLFDTQTKIQKSNCDLMKLQEQANALQQFAVKAQGERDMLLKSQQEIRQQIDDELLAFKTNIVHTVALVAIAEAQIPIDAAQSTMNNQPTSSTLLRYAPEVSSSNFPDAVNITGTDEFLELLQDNLQIAGIDVKCAADAADVIHGTLLWGMPIILCGSLSRGVANAIAAAVSHEECGIVTLPSDYSNIEELLKTVGDFGTNTVLIENLMDTLNEGMFFTAVHHCKGKILLFSLEDVSTLKILSTAILNYAVMINVDELASFPTFEPFEMGCYKIPQMGAEESKIKVKRGCKVLRNLVKNGFLSNGVALNLAKIIGSIEIERADLPIPIWIEIYHCSQRVNKQDKFFEYYQTISHIEDIQALLKQ